MIRIIWDSHLVSFQVLTHSMNGGKSNICWISARKIKLHYWIPLHLLNRSTCTLYQGRICTLTNKNIIFTAKSIQNVPSTVVLSGNWPYPYPLQASTDTAATWISTCSWCQLLQKTNNNTSYFFQICLEKELVTHLDPRWRIILARPKNCCPQKFLPSGNASDLLAWSRRSIC